MTRLPSLRGLQAFDAVARTGSLAGAAEAIGITPSAVSHRVRGLEAELGVRLLQRLPGGLELTDAGARYRRGVEDAFALLASATDDLVGRDASRPLTVSLSSEFGLRWLMPRFHRFRAQHPDIDIALLTTYQVVDLATGDADIALRYGLGSWPGLTAEPVLRFVVSPLCAPGVMEGIKGLTVAEALAETPLIGVDYDDWTDWLAAAGETHVKLRRRLRFADFSHGVTAAINGDGLILGYRGYVETEMAAGLLVKPFELEVPTEKGYHLVYAPDRLADPKVRAFRDWVMAESVRS